MACWASWSYAKDQGILITINQDILNPQKVSRSLALLPQGLAGP